MRNLDTMRLVGSGGVAQRLAGRHLPILEGYLTADLVGQRPQPTTDPLASTDQKPRVKLPHFPLGAVRGIAKKCLTALRQYAAYADVREEDLLLSIAESYIPFLGILEDMDSLVAIMQSPSLRDLLQTHHEATLRKVALWRQFAGGACLATGTAGVALAAGRACARPGVVAEITGQSQKAAGGTAAYFLSHGSPRSRRRSSFSQWNRAAACAFSHYGEGKPSGFQGLGFSLLL